MTAAHRRLESMKGTEPMEGGITSWGILDVMMEKQGLVNVEGMEIRNRTIHTHITNIDQHEAQRLPKQQP